MKARGWVEKRGGYQIEFLSYCLGGWEVKRA